MSTKDYHYYWARNRLVRKKLLNFEKFKIFSDAIYYHDSKNQVFHIDQYKNKINGALFYSEGAPNFNLFKLTPGGEYIRKFSTNTLWKQYEANYDILSKFTTFENNKYIQEETGSIEYDNYDLFLMQMSHTKDKQVFYDALIYATSMKVLTLFKAHPVASDKPSIEVWREANTNGLVSDYTVFVDNVSVDQLIENANIVYSADSAASLNAILAGKKTATFRKNDLCEIIPTISSPEELSTVTPPRMEIVSKFLNWYYNRLCIDINDDAFEDRISYILKSYNNNKSFEEIFK